MLGLFICSIMVPLAAGVLTVAAIVGEGLEWPVLLALGYLAGMGIVTQLMLVLGWLHISLVAGHIDAALAVYIAGMALIFRWGRGAWQWPAQATVKIATTNPLPAGQKLLVGLLSVYIVFQMVYIFWRAFNVPVYQTDAFLVYAYKAKVFFHDHSFQQARHLWPATYPLQVPLTMTWTALNLGQWQEGWVKLPLALNALAFVSVFYSFLKRWASLLASLAATAMLLSSLFFTEHASIAYADFTLMVYTMTAFILMACGLDVRRPGFIWLAGLMAGLGMAVKLNGVCYFFWEGIILIIFLWAGAKGRKAISPASPAVPAKAGIFIGQSLAGFFLPFLVIAALYVVYGMFCGTNKWLWVYWRFLTVPHASGLAWGHLGMAFRILADNLFLSGNWNVLWFVLIVFFAFCRRKSLPAAFFLMALAVFFLNYFLAALFTSRFEVLVGEPHMGALSRMLLHFFPLCPLLIGLSMA